MQEKIQTDGSNQFYIEIPVYGQHLRLTLIQPEQAGWSETSIRVQVRDDNGHLRPGPEIVESKLGDFFQAVCDLMKKSD